eukprot:g37211.t1
MIFGRSTPSGLWLYLLHKMMNSSFERSICFERFDDEKLCPRLLSCGHSFCSGCLEKLLKHDAVTCPTCRKDAPVPKGVHGLPKNFALLDVLAAPKRKEDDAVRICNACDEQHPATSWCLECNENLCKEAARWHTRNITSQPIATRAQVFLPGRSCVQVPRGVRALSAKATAHAAEIKAAEARVVGVHQNLERKHEQEAAKIRATFKEIRDAIAAREKVLLNELDQHHKAKSFSLTNQRELLHTFQACLESAVQRVETATKSPGDAQLLVARSDITSTLSAMASQPPVLDPEADDALEFAIDSKQLLDMFNKAGVVRDNSTSAATTTANGLGLQRACPLQKASFTITARDHKRDARGVGSDTFMVQLQDEKGNPVDVKLEDKGDGTYVASYTLPADTKGDHKLSVLLRGHIQGSPFKVCLLQQAQKLYESVVTFTSESGHVGMCLPQNTLTGDGLGWASPLLQGQLPWICYNLTSQFSMLHSVEMTWLSSIQTAKLVEISTSATPQDQRGVQSFCSVSVSFKSWANRRKSFFHLYSQAGEVFRRVSQSSGLVCFEPMILRQAVEHSPEFFSPLS